MKNSHLTFGLAVIFGISSWTPSLAFTSQDYIHLVSHRDGDGKLMIPAAKTKPAQEKSTQDAPAQKHWGQKELDELTQAKPVQEESVQDGLAQDKSDQKEFEEFAQKEPRSKDPAQERLSEEKVAQEEPAEEESIIKKTVIPAQPKSFSFRDTRWGMSIPEVKANETASFSWELHAPILELGEDRLGYHTTVVEDLEAVIAYKFADNQLTNTKYVFESKHEDEIRYLEDYEKVKNWISQTYGQPKSEEQIWLDDLYNYAEELWGKAVVRGHLTMVAEWEVEETSIVLILNGGDENVGLIADFSSKELPSPAQLVRLPLR